jgi:hypothetical protein
MDFPPDSSVGKNCHFYYIVLARLFSSKKRRLALKYDRIDIIIRYGFILQIEFFIKKIFDLSIFPHIAFVNLLLFRKS